MSYKPKPGSVADRVCIFFLANDGEELTKSDIGEKFDIPTASCDALLTASVRAGLLRRFVHDGLVHFAEGPKLRDIFPQEAQTPAPSTPPPTAADAPPQQQQAEPIKRGKGIALPPLDLDKLQVRIGVPKPPRGGVRPSPEEKYGPVLDRLVQPGACIEVPIEYQAMLKKVAIARKKAGTGTYTVAKLTDTTCGIWRDA